jgi:hypothetical protein
MTFGLEGSVGSATTYQLPEAPCPVCSVSHPEGSCCALSLSKLHVFAFAKAEVAFRVITTKAVVRAEKGKRSLFFITLPFRSILD